MLNPYGNACRCVIYAKVLLIETVSPLLKAELPVTFTPKIDNCMVSYRRWSLDYSDVGFEPNTQRPGYTNLNKETNTIPQPTEDISEIMSWLIGESTALSA